MEDLSDKTLEMLLAEATAGPWEVYSSNSYRRIGTTDRYHEVLAPVRALDGHADMHGTAADLHLAALAPTLAIELLSLRKRVKELEGALLRENERCCCGDHGGVPHNNYADCTRCKERRAVLREGLPDGDG